MLSGLAEMAAWYVRRAPQATPREFARYAAAVADAGLDDDEPGTSGGGTETGSSLRVLTMAGAATLEADHVVLCGMQSARMPASAGGAGHRHRRPGDPGGAPRRHAPADLPRDDPRAPIADDLLRRALRPRHHPGAPPFADEARKALGADWESIQEELGPEETLHATFQALRDELLGDVQRTARGLSELA